MDVDTEYLAQQVFNGLLVVSALIMTLFYLPGNNLLLAKIMALQCIVCSLVALSFMFNPERKLVNYAPALFLLLANVNLFTHSICNNSLIGLSYIAITVLSIYVISNNISIRIVQKVKKAIVVAAIISGLVFISQKFGYSPMMLVDSSHLPSAFMIYPAHLALLLAIGSILAFKLNKAISICLAICMFACGEIAVSVGFIIGVIAPIVSYRLKDWASIVIGIALCVLGYLGASHLGKTHIRIDYWNHAFSSVWARPFDGWGLGYWGLFSNTVGAKDAWLELHNEPLQLFFEMGFLGIAVLIYWFKYMRQYFTWNKYIACLIVFACTSLGHSPFHFADTLWLFVLIYSMWEVEHGQTHSLR